MNTRRDALEKWLLRLERRSTLTDEDRAAVRQFTGNAVTFATSRDIVSLGAKTTHSCLVADGIVARFGQTNEGLRQLSALFIAGDMADLHSAVLPRVSAPLQSALRATVVFVPHDEIIRAAERSPALARAFWRDCVVDGQIAAEWLLNNGRRDARSRVAHLMCELACRYARIGHDRALFPLDLSQNHLADAAGLTAVHVNRTLRLLREAGAFEVQGRHGAVLNWELLRSLADFDPDYLHLEHLE